MTDKESELIEVFAGDPIHAEMIKEILDDNGIASLLKDQYMGLIAPWQVSAGGVDPVKVEVFKKDAEKAIDLINEFKQSPIVED